MNGSIQELELPFNINFLDPLISYRPTFIMLVGVPGSGKSTFAKDLVNTKTKYLSSDAIRGELYGDENCQNDPSKVFSLMHQRTLEALREGYDVVYDATNITRKNRKTILEQLPVYVKKECIIVWAPIDVCIERDLNRDRSVGEKVIIRMLRSFEAPFYDEGFESIKIKNTAPYRIDSYQYYIDSMRALRIPHDNPHHTADVFEHCMLCGKALRHMELPGVVEMAGFIHDIGKPFTKTFVNKKGETTEVAHYYDHQAVGAWISYGFPKASPDLAWLISSHMAPFINQKYYNSLDPLYKKWITALHAADREAH